MAVQPSGPSLTPLYSEHLRNLILCFFCHVCCSTCVSPQGGEVMSVIKTKAQWPAWQPLNLWVAATLPINQQWDGPSLILLLCVDTNASPLPPLQFQMYLIIWRYYQLHQHLPLVHSLIIETGLGTNIKVLSLSLDVNQTDTYTYIHTTYSLFVKVPVFKTQWSSD